MIKVEVEEYCHNCMDFEADVTKPERLYSLSGDDVVFSDTVIHCKYRKRCAGIIRYLDRQTKENRNER